MARPRFLFATFVLLTLCYGALAKDRSADELARAVNAELKSRHEFREVRATADGTVLTLDGTVERYTDKLAAERLVREDDPGAAVRNLITVASARVDDADLRDRVAERLRFAGVDRGMTLNNVSAAVKSGVVTLTGEVHSPVERAAAIAIAGDVPGVQDVVDRVETDPAAARDEDIRVSAARAIYGDPALLKYAADPQAPIRVVVDHGNVTLRGVVSNDAEKRIAEMRAREVPGVYRVENQLVVASPDGK